MAFGKQQTITSNLEQNASKQTIFTCFAPSADASVNDDSIIIATFIVANSIVPTQGEPAENWIQQKTSNIKHQTRNIEHPSSVIKHQTRNIKHQTRNIKHRTRNIEHRTSNIEHQTRGNACTNLRIYDRNHCNHVTT